MRDVPADSYRQMTEDSVVAPFREDFEDPDVLFFLANRENLLDELLGCLVSLVCDCWPDMLPLLLLFVMVVEKPLDTVVLLVEVVLPFKVVEVSSLLLLMPDPADACMRNDYV